MRMMPQDCWGALHCWGALLRGALEGLDGDEDTAHLADDNNFGAVGRGTGNTLLPVGGEVTSRRRRS
jgi:hypothetical protein